MTDNTPGRATSRAGRAAIEDCASFGEVVCCSELAGRDPREAIYSRRDHSGAAADSSGARRTVPESVAGVVSHLSGVGKDASSRARHGAGLREKEDRPPWAVSYPMFRRFRQWLLCSPCPMEQPESKHATSAAKAESARVPDRSRRAFVQPAVAGYGDPRSGSKLNSGHVTTAAATEDCADKCQAVGICPFRDEAHLSTDAHSVLARTGKADASTVAPPNQLLHPQASSSEGPATNAKLIDTHAEKEAAKKVGSEARSFRWMLTIMGFPYRQPQHQAIANPAPQGFHGAQQMIEGQRPQASAGRFCRGWIWQPRLARSSPVRRTTAGRRSCFRHAWLGRGESNDLSSGRVDATLQVQKIPQRTCWRVSRERSLTMLAALPPGRAVSGCRDGGSARDDSVPPTAMRAVAVAHKPEKQCDRRQMTSRLIALQTRFPLSA